MTLVFLAPLSSWERYGTRVELIRDDFPDPDTPVITAEPEDATIFEDEEATLVVEATANGELSYQWYKDGSKIDGANESIYHTEGQMPPGEYFVMLTDMNDMTLPSCSQTVVARDITSQPTEEAPAKKVMYNNHICISIGDTLYDIYGQKVK